MSSYGGNIPGITQKRTCSKTKPVSIKYYFDRRYTAAKINLCPSILNLSEKKKIPSKKIEGVKKKVIEHKISYPKNSIKKKSMSSRKSEKKMSLVSSPSSIISEIIL